MVTGLGLGKFNPLDMKENFKSSSASNSVSSNKAKDNSPSNSFSVASKKSLEKTENKSDYNSKVEKKFDKKHADDQVQEKQSSIHAQDISNLPQMQMLQGVQPTHVNQAATPTKEVDLEVKVSSQTMPVLNFMKALQENFGITPNQFMKALSELPHETMSKSPHQAMTPLFEKLGLQPKDFTKAQILYTEMLTEMEEVQPELFNGKIGTVAGAAPNSFGGSLETPVAPRANIAPKSTLDQLIEQKISRRALEPQNMQVMSQAPKAQANIAQIFQMDPTLGMENASEEMVALNKLKGFDSGIQISEVKINPNSVTNQFLASPQASLQTVQASANMGELYEEMTDQEMADGFAEQFAQMQGGKPVDGSSFAVDKLGAATAAPLADTQLSNENVEKLISGSNSLVKKGGGEMQIQLNPEGLGKIHLNIKVQDGQVGVQMLADTAEAKKLLEASMGDLKTGLAEQRLQLTNSKVELAEQASQHLDQGRDFNRDQAREFLGQFRQFNESMRQGSNDMSAIRSYRRALEPAADIRPIETRNVDPTKSSGLYLVA